MTQRTFIITGGSKGLGPEIARTACERGYSVALIARSEKELKLVVEQLRSDFPKSQVTMHVCDLSQADAVKKAFQEISKQHPHIRALVNNAATWMGRRAIAELTAQEMLDSLNLNFFSAFHATKEMLSLRKGQEDLAIINMGATASTRGAANFSTYCVAKTALRTFSQSLAKELGASGVHVAHLVIDGVIDHERTRSLNVGRPADRFVQMQSLANEVMHVALQNRDCWTFEWDVRTNNAEW